MIRIVMIFLYAALLISCGRSSGGSTESIDSDSNGDSATESIDSDSNWDSSTWDNETWK